MEKTHSGLQERTSSFPRPFQKRPKLHTAATVDTEYLLLSLRFVVSLSLYSVHLSDSSGGEGKGNTSVGIFAVAPTSYRCPEPKKRGRLTTLLCT